MDRLYAAQLISQNLKDIRTEENYTQDKMADILGISKKTLIQIEKERIIASWTICVAICAIFHSNPILQKLFGGNPLDTIELLSLNIDITRKEKTMGGYVWWRNIIENNQFKLQQNVLSQHYRIIDSENYRLISSFSEQSIHSYWEKLNSK